MFEYCVRKTLFTRSYTSTLQQYLMPYNHESLGVKQWDNGKSLTKSQHGFTARVKAEVNAQSFSGVSHYKCQ